MEPAGDEHEITETSDQEDMIDFVRKKFPRVGDEYQAEILSLESQCQYAPDAAMNKFCGEVFDPETIEVFSRETEDDQESLLLGLYIFGKDFNQIREFVGCKLTGDISRFYYGNEFYKSKGRRAWSSSKKAKRKKIVLGKKIFSSFRLKELLSRLSAHISEEDKKSLSNGSKLLGEGKMSLPEYVSTIKAVTGMKNFVEAMAIGKGKKDITRMIRGPPRQKKQLDLPEGKTSFSSLTPAEIINFLSGALQKRKDVLNDLFWEAVWPRLLSGGWHSEQPKFCTAKQLVFLVPGITKFSRRLRLVKGIHYFDSIPDVLNKVLSVPSLLELEPQPDQSKNKDSKTVKFTVVDTSRNMSNGLTYSIKKMIFFPGNSSSSKIVEASEEESSEDDMTDSSTGEVNIKKSDAENGLKHSGLKESNEGTEEADSSSLDPMKKRQKKIALCDDDLPLISHNYSSPLAVPPQPETKSLSEEVGNEMHAAAGG